MDQAATVDLVGVLNWLWGHLGPRATIFVIFAVPITFVAWQVWLTYRKDRQVDAALAAKEDTIQRLAEENRIYRIQLFKEKFGWTDEQIDSWIVNNESPAKREQSKKKSKK